MNFLRTSVAAAALVALLLPAASLVSHAAAARPGTHWGSPQPLGSGSARAWVAVDMDGAPVSMGVSLDEKAMASARAQRQDVVLPLPMTAGVSQPGPESKLAFRVRWDEVTRSYVVTLDGVQSLPPGAVAH